jgi:hypothetical protein
MKVEGDEDLERQMVQQGRSRVARFRHPGKEKEFFGGADFLGDVPLSLTVSAVEGAARDTYGLIDNFLFLDQLPELGRDRYLWEPRTGMGELASGVGEAILISKGLGAIPKVGASLTAAERTLEQAVLARTGSRYLASAMKGAANGIPIDFIMSQQGGAGISSILAQLEPGTLQEIGSLLASDLDDSALEKSIKGVLEGTVLGFGAGLFARWWVKRRDIKTQKKYLASPKYVADKAAFKQADESFQQQFAQPWYAAARAARPAAYDAPIGPKMPSPEDPWARAAYEAPIGPARQEPSPEVIEAKRADLEEAAILEEKLIDAEVTDEIERLVKEEIPDVADPEEEYWHAGKHFKGGKEVVDDPDELAEAAAEAVPAATVARKAAELDPEAQAVRELIEGDDFRPGKMDPVKYRTRSGSKQIERELIFDDPVDAAIFVAAAKSHPMKEKAIDYLTRAGIYDEDSVAAAAKVLKDESKIAEPRTIGSKTVIPIRSLGWRERLMEKHGFAPGEVMTARERAGADEGISPMSARGQAEAASSIEVDQRRNLAGEARGRTGAQGPLGSAPPGWESVGPGGGPRPMAEEMFTPRGRLAIMSAFKKGTGLERLEEEIRKEFRLSALKKGNREALRQAGDDPATAATTAASGVLDPVKTITALIGKHLIGDISFGTVRGVGGAFAADKVTALGSEELARAIDVSGPLIAFGRDTVLGGRRNIQKVIFHELFHSLERYLTADEAESVTRQFLSEKARATNPNAYRWTNPSEYWAERAAETAMKRLDRMEAIADPGFKGLASKAWYYLVDLFDSLKGFLGIDKTKALLTDFLTSGKMDAQLQGGSIRDRGPLEIFFSEEAAKAEDRIFGRTKDGKPDLDEVHKIVTGEDPVIGDPSSAPAKMSSWSRFVQAITKGMLNTTIVAGDRDALALIRHVSRAAIQEGSHLPQEVVHVKEFALSTLAEIADIVGAGNPSLFARSIEGAPHEVLRKVAVWAHAMQSVLIGQAERTSGMVKALMAKDVTSRSAHEKALVMEAIEFTETLTKHVELYRAEVGRDMRFLQEKALVYSAETREKISQFIQKARGVSADAAAKQAEEVGFTPAQAAEVKAGLDQTVPVRELANDPAGLNEWISKRGGMEKIEAALDAQARLIQMGLTPAQVAKGTREIARANVRLPKVWDFVNSIFIKHILSGFRTPAAVAISEGLATAIGPARHWLGAGVAREFYRLRNNPTGIRQMTEVMAEAGRTYKYILGARHEAWRAAKRAYSAGQGFVGGTDTVAYNQAGGERFTHQNYDLWLDTQKSVAPDFVKPIYDKNAPHAQFIRYMMAQRPGSPGYTGVMSYFSTRPLVAIDDFMRTLVARPAMRAILESDVAKAMPGSPGAWDAEVERRMAMAFDADGRLISKRAIRARMQGLAAQKGLSAEEAKPWVDREVDRVAKEAGPELMKAADFVRFRGDEAAATLPIEEGSISGAVSRFVENQGWPRLFMPFIQSSTSIARTVGQHFDLPSAWHAWRVTEAVSRGGTPAGLALGKAKRQIAKELLSSDPRVRAEATGRLSAGFFAAAGFGAWAATETGEGLPVITGALASSKEVRELQKKRGLQEYSIYVSGVGYVSYARLDPFATVVGVMADIVNYAKLHPDSERSSLGDLGGSVITALAHNFQSKSYLVGITSIMEAIDDKDPRGVYRVLQNLAGSMLVPNVVAQQGQALFGDDMMRAVGANFFDVARRRSPYFGETLPVQRDLLGEPIPRQRFVDGGFLLPFAFNEVKDDVVVNELHRLGHSFGSPDPERNGIDLREIFEGGRQAYDRYGELIGTTKISGRSLRQALQAAIGSPQYRALPLSDHPGVDHPQVRVLQGVLHRYRTKAYGELLGEFRELKQAAVEARMYKMRRNRSPYAVAP